MEKEIHHPRHEHPLILSGYNSRRVDCSLCGRYREDDYVYVCVNCKYFLHMSCADMSAEFPQEISHSFHPQHPLMLRRLKYWWCSSCHEKFYHGLFFCCIECSVYLDPKCAIMPDINPNQGQEYIRHFSHQHSLVLLDEDHHDQIKCFACEISFSSSNIIYGCPPCEYFLHKSCCEFPKKTLHVMHPHHALTLCVTFGECNLCHTKKDYTFKFKCGRCDFFLHVNCALLSVPVDIMSCFVCGKDHSEPTYSCPASKYYHKQSYLELPEVIKSTFHPHNLTLKPSNQRFRCDFCNKKYYNVPSFRCHDCEFRIDIRCGLIASILYEDQAILIQRHFNHQHTWTEVTEAIEGEITCCACKGSCLVSVYACTSCEYFLHKSCAEMLQKSDHKNHPDECTCKSCYRSRNLSKPSIDYKYHDHPLYIVEMMDSELKCNAYDASCEFLKMCGEFKFTECFSFSCVDCDFHLHFLCGPLPCTIKHKCHLHDLKLVDSSIEDDSGEYYCDVCEEERNPRVCVYYCEQCEFVAHVHCVISEVMRVLKRESREKELRIVGEWSLNYKEMKQNNLIQETAAFEFEGLSTLKDLLDSLTYNERSTMVESFPFLDDGDDDEDSGQETDEEVDKILFYSPYQDSFRDKLLTSIIPYRFNKKSYINPQELQSKLVNVQGYLINSNLAPILEQIFSIHGDLSTGSKLNIKQRSIVFHHLCRLINKMCRTYVADITDDRLRVWKTYLSRIEDAGFNVDFIYDRIKDVIDAYVGLEITRYDDEIPVKLDRVIEKLDKKVADITGELDKVTESTEKFMLLAMEPIPDNVHYYVKKANSLRWKTAGAGFF